MSETWLIVFYGSIPFNVTDETSDTHDLLRRPKYFAQYFAQYLIGVKARQVELSTAPIRGNL